MMRRAVNPLCLGLFVLGLVGSLPVHAAADVLFDAAATAGVMVDDNVAALDKDSSGNPTVEGSLASFDGGFTFVWDKDAAADVSKEAIVGIDFRMSNQGSGKLSEVNPLVYGLALNGSVDARVADDESAKLRKLTFGLELDWNKIQMGGSDFQNALTITPAVKLTFTGDGACDLNNLLLYGQRSEIDDEESPLDPVYDRSGDTDVFGMEYTHYGAKASRQCERWSPFRSFVPLQSWSFSVGFRHEDRETDGTEFDSDSTELYVEAYLPLLDRTDPRWGFGGRLDYERLSYDATSIVTPGTRRDDDNFYSLEATVRRGFLKGACGEECEAARLKQFAMEFGVGYERLSSDIPLYDYARTYFFAAFNIRWSTNNPNQADGRIGAETRRRTDHAGSSRPTSSQIQRFVP